MSINLNIFRCLFFFIACLLILSSGYAQSEAISNDTAMEQIPIFEGGNDKLLNFINYYMIYPKTALYDSIEGKVVVSFMIDKKGTMKDIMISKSVYPSLDSEAIRVVRLMSQVLPKWKPGRHEARAISMKDSLEVNFNVNIYERANNIHHGDREPTPAFDLNRFLNDNLKYPQNSKEKGIEGSVLIKFVISEDGSLSGLKVIKSVDVEMDLEALRLIRMMPKWNPAIQNGHPVKVYFTLPVRFSLHK